MNKFISLLKNSKIPSIIHHIDSQAQWKWSMIWNIHFEIDQILLLLLYLIRPILKYYSLLCFLSEHPGNEWLLINDYIGR